MLDKEKLRSLYNLYGFELSSESIDLDIFTYSDGYFYNAELVKYNETYDACATINEYKKIGYSSAREVFHNSLDEANSKLFKGFFKIEQTNKRILNEYQSFCALQTKKLGSNAYSYITGNYYSSEAEGGSSRLIDVLYERLTGTDAKLTILEAAAGFGKTCTSYEVLKKLADAQKSIIPLLAELSKNRQATLFKYVLFDEIERRFPSLSLKLVEHEIKAGRIPLIIDGFDELLSNSILGTDVNGHAFAEAQTMLDTIADLLVGDSKAKILLTSRKSSIFTGEVFDTWVVKQLDKCSVQRVTLASPTIAQWLGSDKAKHLRAHGQNFENIANPVLLTLLRNVPSEEFIKHVAAIEGLIAQYFETLLTRERERQSLLLTPDEQYQIMRRLAAYMVEFDISSEDPLFIKDMIADIIKPQLSKFESRYENNLSPVEDKPTTETFLMKLVHHAVLDRLSANSNKIGFINEFVFGLFIADAIKEQEISNDHLVEKYLTLAATAYSVKSKAQRDLFYSNIVEALELLSDEQRLYIDINLINGIGKDYKGLFLESIDFANIKFGPNFVFDGCIFKGCSFSDVTIDLMVFNNCQFINCKFFRITATNSGNKDLNVIFSSCTGADIFDLLFESTIETHSSSINYERVVLEQYWKQGYDSAELRRTYRTLYKGTKKEDQRHVTKAIESLLRRGLLLEKSYCLELNFEHIDEIKNILGRV